MMNHTKRRKLLIKFLKEQIKKPKPEFNLGVVYLFYDGFSLQSIEVEEIDPYK